jgi:translation elongation factor EF-1alpha
VPKGGFRTWVSLKESIFYFLIAYILLHWGWLQGKTVEVGRAHFETEKSRFTILDAPVSDSYLQSLKNSLPFSL